MSKTTPRQIEALEEAIRRMHGVPAAHLGTVPVHQKIHDKTVWEGNVEIFTLKDHAKAKECFAWTVHDEDATQYISVLRVAPVQTPADAIKAYIVSQHTT